ncbi:MAG TPA: trans-sialidase, partial [Candidatus Nitrosotenuis sp.]
TKVEVPTSDWNLQKAKVTGYTQPSNKYFATRERLAYHPRDKYFAGYGIKGGATQLTTTAPPPKPQIAPPQTAQSSSGGKTKKEQLEDYEKQYLARLQQQQQEARSRPPPPPTPTVSKGSMPKGWTPS